MQRGRMMGRKSALKVTGGPFFIKNRMRKNYRDEKSARGARGFSSR